MSRRPDIYITVKGAKLLLKGIESDHCCRTVSCTGLDDPGPCRIAADYSLTCRPRWSDAGRGYVLPSAHLPDVLAYAQSHRLLAVFSDITGRKRVAS